MLASLTESQNYSHRRQITENAYKSSRRRKKRVKRFCCGDIKPHANADIKENCIGSQKDTNAFKLNWNGQRNNLSAPVNNCLLRNPSKTREINGKCVIYGHHEFIKCRLSNSAESKKCCPQVELMRYKLLDNINEHDTVGRDIIEKIENQSKASSRVNQSYQLKTAYMATPTDKIAHYKKATQGSGLGTIISRRDILDYIQVVQTCSPTKFLCRLQNHRDIYKRSVIKYDNQIVPKTSIYKLYTERTTIKYFRHVAKNVANEANNENTTHHIKSTIKYNCLFVTRLQPSQALQSKLPMAAIHEEPQIKIYENSMDHTYCSQSTNRIPSTRTRKYIKCKRKLLRPTKARPRKHLNYATLPTGGGSVISCSYSDYFLVVAQTEHVNFFQQTGIGMFIDSQTMWLHCGRVDRMNFDASHVRKTARDCVLHSDNEIAYAELFCREHHYDGQEVPNCDIFVVLYYLRPHDAPRCKVHQLNKFTGYAEHVSFVVLQDANCITVYYESLVGTSMRGIVRHVNSYQFSSDYQLMIRLYEHEGPLHNMSSLHIANDSKRIIVGLGSGQMTIWKWMEIYKNVAIPDNAHEAKSIVQCDREFIFALQPLRQNNLLRLIAINLKSSVRRVLHTYKPPRACRTLQHAFMKDGLIVAIYDRHRVCWNINPGKLIGIQRLPLGHCTWPSGHWLLSVRSDRVFVHRLWKTTDCSKKQKR